MAVLVDDEAMMADMQQYGMPEVEQLRTAVVEQNFLGTPCVRKLPTCMACSDNMPAVFIPAYFVWLCVIVLLWMVQWAHPV